MTVLSVARRRGALLLAAAAVLLGGCAPKTSATAPGAAVAGTAATVSAAPGSSGAAASGEPSASPAAADPGSSSPSGAPSAPPFMPPSTPPASPAAPAADSSATPPPHGRSAQAVLATLAVKGRAPLTGYTRDQYGQAWADVDRNGCDTRNDILRRDLHDQVLKPGTAGCVVASGQLDDPYTGRQVDFVRGETTSTAVQIDHVVALADSWVTGASAWDERKRIAFANDPLNLLAVDGPTNEQKGAGDAATWLPRASYRCAYVARQIAVKAKYGLWVKTPERDAMNRILDTCPNQETPAYGAVELPSPGLGSAQHDDPAPTPMPVAGNAPASGGLDPRFPYCTDAKTAGYGPYVQGRDPEYDWYRDADHDGIVCE